MKDEFVFEYWSIEHWDSTDGYMTRRFCFGTYRRRPTIDDYECIIENHPNIFDMINGDCYLHELLENGYTGDEGYGFKLVERKSVFKYDKLHGE